jgi:hypothetical protein
VAFQGAVAQQGKATTNPGADFAAQFSSDARTAGITSVALPSGRRSAPAPAQQPVVQAGDEGRVAVEFRQVFDGTEEEPRRCPHVGIREADSGDEPLRRPAARIGGEVGDCRDREG